MRMRSVTALERIVRHDMITPIFSDLFFNVFTEIKISSPTDTFGMPGGGYGMEVMYDQNAILSTSNMQLID